MLGPGRSCGGGRGVAGLGHAAHPNRRTAPWQPHSRPAPQTRDPDESLIADGFTTLVPVSRPGSATPATVPVDGSVVDAPAVDRPSDAAAALPVPDADEGDPHRPGDSDGVPPQAHGRRARTVVRTPA